MTISRRIVAEALGTALLLAAVVGSGIMGKRLALGNVAIALLANTVATGAILITLIFTFGPISRAHFNTAVTVADAWQCGIAWRLVPLCIAGQIAGAFLGVIAALGSGAGRGGPLYQGRLLVHSIHVIRESGCQPRAGFYRYVRGNSSARCAGVCLGKVLHGNGIVSLAGAFTTAEAKEVVIFPQHRGP